MAFPPAHAVVGAAVADLARGTSDISPRRAALAGAALSILPDLDIILSIAMERGAEYHGTFTHSIVAVIVLGGFATVLFGRAWGAICAAGYGSHLLVDLLDDRGRTNVLLGWPFTHEKPYAIGRLFPKVGFNSAAGMQEALRTLTAADSIRAIVVQTLLALLVAAPFVAAGWALRRAAGPRPLR